MVKKLTSDDWDEIQKQSPSRYYIQSEEDGRCVDRDTKEGRAASDH